MSFATRFHIDRWEVLADGRPLLATVRERTADYIVSRLASTFPAESSQHPPHIAAMIWAEAFRADVETLG